MLRKEVAEGKAPEHLIKCQQRLSELRNILSDAKESISRLDRNAAEALMRDLRDAIRSAE